MLGIFEKEVLITRAMEETIIANNNWDDISVESGIVVKVYDDLVREVDERPIENINSF